MPSASRPAILAPKPPEPKAPAQPSATDLLSIVRMLPDVVFRCVKDTQGTIRWTLNEGKLAEEFHITTKDVYNKSLAEMFPPDIAARNAAHFEAAFRGEPHEWVHEMGGRQFKHFPQPVLGPDGKVAAVVGFITDVTTLAEAEEQAKRLNGELLRRLVELREANLSLEQANRDLDGFASAASHDLRNPLSVIATVAKAIELRHGSQLDDESRASLGKITSAVRRMDDLIGDLLRFSRATQQGFKAEPLDITAMARDAAEALKAQDPQRKAEIVIQDGLKATGDRGLLRVAIENLLGNAWKYTGQAPQAKITLRSEGRDPVGRQVLAICDNGIGFDPAEATGLFQAFQRLPSSKGFPGTGMGLATVRRIVERHGGRIWAESKPGQGATFRFTLAALPPAATAAA